MNFKDLMDNYAQPGTVTWISIRPQRKLAVQPKDQIKAIENLGLEGDHYANPGGTRQVTLIQKEHLDAVASFLGKNIDPALVRRNIVISGINILSLKDQQFTVGEAILQYTGECHPCSRMEENLGTGGYNAMRGHGGITAKIIRGGIIRKGDSVHIINTPVQPELQRSNDNS